APDTQGKVPLGARLPTIVVSPFSPATFSSFGGIYDHTSVLKMIEWRFLNGATIPPSGNRPAGRDANGDMTNLACALNLNGPPAYQTNTANGLLVNLATDSTGSSLQGWGWANGAYWTPQTATVSFPTTGVHTIRVQVREYGVEVDQIVLSPGTYFNQTASCPNACSGSPGLLTNDHTIVSKPNAAPGTPNSPSPASGATNVSTNPSLTWSATGATSYDVFFGTSNPPPQVATGQTTASYTPATLANSTTYFWKVVARNSAGSTSGPVWSFTTASGAQPPATPNSHS